MQTRNKRAANVVIVGTMTVPLFAGEDAKKTWTFDDKEVGAIAGGFTNEVGEWIVVSTPEGKVLAQTANSANPVSNVELASDTDGKDIDISVRMKAVAGENDHNGGLVWRAKDAKNYYVARNNPLRAGSYNVYKVCRSNAVDVPRRTPQALGVLAHPSSGDDR
jgi:hypothetical protein